MNTLLGREVVIVGAVRTPIGKGHPEKGQFRNIHPNTLLGGCYTEVLRRSSVDASLVDDVLAGCVQQIGEQGCNIARNAWLDAGLPAEVPATTIDRQCGSSQQAVNFAATSIAAGVNDIVVAGGVEHMGRIPFGVGVRVQDEFGEAVTAHMQEVYGLVPKHSLVGQGIAAELIAAKWGVSRSELDDLAVRSHALAHEASTAGRFHREIVDVEVDGQTVSTDQGIRADTTAEVLATLKPVFEADGLVTAATSSQVSDGASAVLLMSREKAHALGLSARARIVDLTAVGVDPRIMLTGPIPATHKILERNNLTISDIDLFEVNEAFASVVAAWQRELSPDFDRVNSRGGAMALGHPVGASGGRLVTTLLHQLEDEDKQLGLVTMCCGGGLGTATLIERL